MPGIRVFHGALDDAPGEKLGMVLRGVLNPNDLYLLQRAEYQREVLPFSTISQIVDAFENGDAVPDIDLGMRGSRCLEREGVYYLHDEVFIIDGLQRVQAALHFLKKHGDAKSLRLGATIHFDTTEEWERQRFRVLNAERKKVSPNVLLRNMRYDISAVDTLIQLTEEKGFVLQGRVSWSQRMNRAHLLSALTFLKTIGALHAHLGPGRSNQLTELCRGIQKIMDATGRNTMRDNVRTFFDLIDKAWGIERITFRESACYLRSTFLWCLAKILSNHLDFWRGDKNSRLFVEADLMRKIALFPVNDPEIVRLAAAGGKARELLCLMMRDHINSGKRSRRLRPREISQPSLPVQEVSGEVVSTA